MKNTKKHQITDSVPDLAEPFLDEASTKIAKELFGIALPDIVKDLPVLKYVKTASDVYGAYRLAKMHRRLKAFLETLLAGGFTLKDFSKLPAEEQEYVIDILVTELDTQSDNLQSKATAYLFNAYVSGSIDRLTFMGIAHELKNTNPLIFYFNVDSIGVTEKHKDKDLAVSGPVHYLPSSFYSTSTDKLAFSSGGPFLTNLGKAFYKHVYEPMSHEYTL